MDLTFFIALRHAARSMRRLLRHGAFLTSLQTKNFRVSMIRPHCSGCAFPSPHLKALGSATQGQARDRDSRAALGNPQDKGQLRQTFSGRSARVATRPESQAAPPHKFNLPRRLSPPSHGSADRRLRPVYTRSYTLSRTLESGNYYQDAIQFLSLKEVDGVYFPSENSNPLLWLSVKRRRRRSW
jgi:hypothetical protein